MTVMTYKEMCARRRELLEKEVLTEDEVNEIEQLENCLDGILDQQEAARG